MKMRLLFSLLVILVATLGFARFAHADHIGLDPETNYNNGDSNYARDNTLAAAGGEVWLNISSGPNVAVFSSAGFRGENWGNEDGFLMFDVTLALFKETYYGQTPGNLYSFPGTLELVSYLGDPIRTATGPLDSAYWAENVDEEVTLEYNTNYFIGFVSKPYGDPDRYLSLDARDSQGQDDIHPGYNGQFLFWGPTAETEYVDPGYQFAGTWYGKSLNFGGDYNLVPEPSSAVLLGIALVSGLALVLRRRTRTAG